jgi:hypothetical protein
LRGLDGEPSNARSDTVGALKADAISRRAAFRHVVALMTWNAVPTILEDIDRVGATMVMTLTRPHGHGRRHPMVSPIDV